MGVAFVRMQPGSLFSLAVWQQTVQQTGFGNEASRAVAAGHVMPAKTARLPGSGQLCAAIKRGGWLRRQTWGSPVRSGLLAPEDPRPCSLVVSSGGGHQREQDPLPGYTLLRRVHRYQCGYRFLCYIVLVLHNRANNGEALSWCHLGRIA